jgi:hypothetical protein
MSRFQNAKNQAKIEDIKEQAGISNKVKSIMAHNLAEVSFVARKLSICLTHENIGEILELRALGLHFNSVKRPYDLEAKVTLTDFLIEDKFQSHGEDFKYLVDTESIATLEVKSHLFSTQTELFDKHFITIAYKNIQPNSPEYCGLDSTATVDVDTLNIMVNPHTVATVMTIAKNVASAWNGTQYTEDKNNEETSAVTTVSQSQVHHV